VPALGVGTGEPVPPTFVPRDEWLTALWAELHSRRLSAFGTVLSRGAAGRKPGRDRRDGRVVRHHLAAPGEVVAEGAAEVNESSAYRLPEGGESRTESSSAAGRGGPDTGRRRAPSVAIEAARCHANASGSALRRA